MKLWYRGEKGSLLLGKCEEVLRKFPENSIDAIVTDPPYGLSFMGKHWDYQVPTVAQWQEIYRVLKPGGHLLSFAGSRTYHRMAVNIEDAGFEIRDQIMWVYGSGFPKSLDISKAIDKAAGVEREIVGKRDVGPDIRGDNYKRDNGERMIADITVAATREAIKWGGWGTALKPAHEPIVLARKPLGEKTVAANVLKYGTGGINVDGCRVGLNGDYKSTTNGRPSLTGLGDNYDPTNANQPSNLGRFPANFIHDGSEEVVSCFPEVKVGSWNGRRNEPKTKNAFGTFELQNEVPRQGSEGSAARFFYCAKASKSERGLNNSHPTVKPKALISYLIKLVLPPGGIVLDPFSGSGTLAVVCEDEGIRWCCIDDEEKHCEIAEGRLRA